MIVCYSFAGDDPADRRAGDRVAVEVLERRHRVRRVHARQLPPDLRPVGDHRGDPEQRRRSRCWPSLIGIPVGFAVARHPAQGRSGCGSSAPVLDFLVAMPLGIPAVVFGVGFLLTYTQEPFFLYGTRWVIVLVYVTVDAAVHHTHAAGRDGLARRHVRRGGAHERRRRAADQPADRPAAAAIDDRRCCSADVRAPDARVRGVAARAGRRRRR